MKRSSFQPRTKPMKRAAIQPSAKAASGILRTAKPRMRKCRMCTGKFIPARTTQKVCGQKCAAADAAVKRAKAERQADRVRREALKTRSDWIKEAQREFNASIRERDRSQPCISCGRPLQTEAVGGGYDCGHYRSVGSAPHLRFDERNAHGQCKQCNRYGAGRAVDYRIGLIARIGLEAVEALEADQESRNWSIDDLKAIRDEYRAKRKALKEAA